MPKNVMVLLVVALLLIASLAAADATPRLNPYAPMNAVAAQPVTPYNLWDIPRISRTSYEPCPTCVPPAALLPDLPPVSQPFPGPFGIPVPVP